MEDCLLAPGHQMRRVCFFFFELAVTRDKVRRVEMEAKDWKKQDGATAMHNKFETYL
jgi:hypothetical protein